MAIKRLSSTATTPQVDEPPTKTRKTTMTTERLASAANITSTTKEHDLFESDSDSGNDSVFDLFESDSDIVEMTQVMM